MTHTIKGLRAQFKAVGKFHTPPELALFLRSLIPGEPSRVYDPTCGAGALLSVFPEETEKYGQDIDEAALADAELLPNFHGHLGDVLADPAWVNERFEAIVANPPFSIRWEPRVDERFLFTPEIPTASRADYAFILHIVHMLAEGGTAAVLSFPGVLYRGGREGKIRRWLVEEGLVERVLHIPGDRFTDTSIATCVLVLRKGRDVGAPIVFEDTETGAVAEVPVEQVAANDFGLSVGQYAVLPEPEREPVDPAELEGLARANALRKVRAEIQVSLLVAELEGWDVSPFLDDLAGVVDEFRSVA